MDLLAVGIMVVNMAEYYWSPTRDTSDISRHRNIGKLAAETVELYRNLPLRNAPSEGPGLEAAAVVVIKHDNLAKNPELPLEAPEPQPEAPASYDFDYS